MKVYIFMMKMKMMINYYKYIIKKDNDIERNFS